MEFEIIQTIALIFGPGGAVYFGLKSALNGLKELNEKQIKVLNHVDDDVRSIKQEIFRGNPE